VTQLQTVSQPLSSKTLMKIGAIATGVANQGTSLL